MKALYAGLMASLLIVSILSVAGQQHQQAYAQTTAPYGKMTAYVQYVFTDGTTWTPTSGKDTKQIPSPLDVLGQDDLAGTKKIASVNVGVSAILPGATDKITSQTINLSATVIDVSGTSRSLALSNIEGAKQLVAWSSLSQTSTWQVYKATITAPELESKMGTITGSAGVFASNLRIFIPSSSTVSGTFGGQTGLLYTPTMTAEVQVLKQASGTYTLPPPTQTPTCQTGQHLEGNVCVADPVPTPTPQEPVPTGKLFSVVTVEYMDGYTHPLVSDQIGSFNVADIISAKDDDFDSSGIKSISYSLRATPDNDAYSYPQQLSYASPGTSPPYNYDVSFNNGGVNKNYNANIQRLTSSDVHAATWELMRMTVQSDALAGRFLNALPTSTGSISVGTLTFHVAASTLKLTSTTGKVWNVQIPEQNTSVDLRNYSPKVTNPGDGSCDINGETCNPDNGSPSQISLSGPVLIGIVAGIAVAMAGGGYVLIKRRK
jgi:hypothetical protein